MKIKEVLCELDFFETKATGLFDEIELNDVIREHYQFLRQHGKQIGSTGGFSVPQAQMDGNTYIVGIRVNGMIAAFVKFSLISLFNVKYINVILVHSLANMAKQHPQLKTLVNKNLLMMLLEFMRNHYKVPFIDYEGYQSDDGIRAIRVLSRGHKVQWLNIKTGEIVDYDPSKDKNPKHGNINEPYRSFTTKTDWRTIVESSGTHEIDDYSIHEIYMNMFNKGFKQTDK